uniref:Uncharacterized protein n=1 Tax=Cacopsylla melanoneura TaxID=428564 RepID=A0A8D8ZDA8_9HEMI
MPNYRSHSIHWQNETESIMYSSGNTAMYCFSQKVYPQRKLLMPLPESARVIFLFLIIYRAMCTTYLILFTGPFKYSVCPDLKSILPDLNFKTLGVWLWTKHPKCEELAYL